MSKAKSGGGPRMNKVRSVGVRTGSPTANKVSPAAAANQGISKGNHAMSGDTRRPPEPLVTGKMQQVQLGNAKALAVGAGKPGADRIVHRSGSQGTHGAVNPGPPLSAPQGGGPAGFGFPDKKGS